MKWVKQVKLSQIFKMRLKRNQIVKQGLKTCLISKLSLNSRKICFKTEHLISGFLKNKKQNKKIHTEKARLNIGIFQNRSISLNHKRDIVGCIIITKTLIQRQIVYHHQEMLPCTAQLIIIKESCETTKTLLAALVFHLKLHL